MARKGESVEVFRQPEKAVESVEVWLAEGALGRMLTLRSSDGVDFDVEEKVALESQTIEEWLKEDSHGDVISLFNIDSKILRPILQFCKKHAMARTAAATAASAHPAAAAAAASAKPAIKIKVYSQKELKAFDTQFIKDNETSLVYLIEAAKFLGIKRLQELTLDAAANMTKGKTPEQIRKIFNIKSDFTPDEETKARRENKWVFEQ